MNEVMVEGMEVVGFNRIPDDKKSSGMTIVAAASYRVTLLESVRSADVTRAFPDSWEAKIEGFLNQKHIVVLKRTKRSEAEVDIRPMIYQMHLEEDGIHLFLAAGSEQNLKPDLVMRAFTEYIKEESNSVPFHYHRVDVYARKPKEAEDSEDHFKFISLGEWKRS